MPGQTTTPHSKPASQPRQGQQRSGQSKPVRRGAPQQGRPASSQPKTTSSQPRPAQQQRPASSQPRPASQSAGSSAPGQPRRNKVVVNQPQSGGQYGDKSRKNKQQRTKESTKRQAMLNTHRINPFKYDMNQILEASSMDPAKASSFPPGMRRISSRRSSMRGTSRRTRPTRSESSWTSTADIAEARS